MTDTMQDTLSEMEPAVRSIPRAVTALQAFMLAASKTNGLEQDACEGLYDLLAPIYDHAFEIQRQWEVLWQAHMEKRS